MRQVTKEEFYGEIKRRGLNVHPRIVGPVPYVSIFEFPDRREFGRIIPGERHWNADDDRCYVTGH